MNNSRWGGSVPINRLLKKPNPALNRETNSHPPKPQTPAEPLLNISSPERGSTWQWQGGELAPVPLLEHPVMIPAPHARMSSTALGNPAGVTGGSGTEAMRAGRQQHVTSPMGLV